MTQKQEVQLFEEKKVRTIWDEEHEKQQKNIINSRD